MTAFEGGSQDYWAHYQGGNNVDETLGSATDQEGNLYATGYFSTAATINQVDLTVNGLTDIYVSKVAQDGVTEWSLGFGGSQSDRGLGIGVDEQGNVLVCGFYTGFVNFGNGVELTSVSGSQDAFILKLDPNGNPLWARSGGGAGGSDRANAVAIDPLGNVVITGQFTGSAQFGSLVLNADDGTNDVFIVKYDSDGNEAWAKQGTGQSLDRGLAVATDDEGGVYATGQFSGDITFDNTYPNNIVNAFFLIKYDSAGVEEWFRWAGGTEDCIAYGMTCDGTDVYLTGDFGTSMGVLGLSQTVSLSSGFDESIFILSFSSDGSYNWGATAGSGSLVSSRAIDYRDGQLAIAGWYNCTFESYSQQYGEATFNSIGFKDAFMARYVANTGEFDWARNFGSRNDEEALTVTILDDGYEVVGGVFEGQLILPTPAPTISGNVSIVSITDQSYCGDDNYETFVQLIGESDQDGFLVKVLDQDRLPYDYYMRNGSGCDFGIPEPCSQISGLMNCLDSAIACAPYSLMANPNTLPNGIGYDFEVNWTSPFGMNSSLVLQNQSGDYIVSIESVDGCYTVFDTIYADTYPPALVPAISDNVIVNDSTLTTQTIVVCEGDTVLVWGHIPEGYNFNWVGTGGLNIPNQDTLEITQYNFLNLLVTNEFDCVADNLVEILFEQVPEDLPIDVFLPDGDSVSVCIDQPWVDVGSLIAGTDEFYPSGFGEANYDFLWILNGETPFGNGASASFFVEQSGWYEVMVTVEPTPNDCHDLDFIYTDMDSIYVEILENPEVILEIEGPEFICPGDTLAFLLNYEGHLTLPSNIASFSQDSVFISESGGYTFLVDSTSLNGCDSFSSETIIVQEVSTPQIFSNPPDAVICPQDSVELYSDIQGDFLWQGPSGAETGGNNIWVDESGLYFAEVTFYEGCALVSNTVQIGEYSTPFLSAGDGLLCEGGELEIILISTNYEAVNWLPPFSGNDTTQIVTEPGIYSVIATACDITTELSIEIQLADPQVEIFLANPEPTCEGDSILVIADGPFDNFTWSPAGAGTSVWFQDPGPVSVSASAENGCQAVSDTISLSFEPLPPPPAFEYFSVCEGETFVLNVSPDLEVNFIEPLEGTIVSNLNPYIVPELWNDTTFIAFLSSEFCDGPIAEVEISPKPFPEVPIPASNAPVCTGETLILEVLDPDTSHQYFWIVPSGATLSGNPLKYNVFDLSQEGDYFVFADLDGCVGDSASLPVSLIETREVDLPPDTAMCFRDDFIVATDTIFASYLWSDNSTDSVFFPTTSGQVFITVTDFNGCESFDVMNLEFADCTVDIPNVFTPNGDGLNDVWFVGLDRPLFFEVVIYNRWGRIVYESNDHLRAWDGVHYKSGELCSEATYFFILRGLDFERRGFEETGTITLIRD